MKDFDLLSSLEEDKAEKVKNKSSIKEPEKPIDSNFILHILSFFSIVFGGSIVTLLDFDLIGILISVFIIVILILNEKFKTLKIKEYFETENQTALAVSVITVLISFVSLYGIYINVNNIEKINTTKQSKIEVLELTFNTQKDSLERLNLKVDSILSESESYKSKSSELKVLIKERSEESNKYNRELEYYDNRIDKLSTEIEEERQSIKKNLNSKLSELKQKYNKEVKLVESSSASTNERIIIIAVILVIISLIVEGGIVFICRHKGILNKEYNEQLRKYKEEQEKIKQETLIFINRQPETEYFKEYLKHINIIYTIKRVNDKVTKEELEKSVLGSRLDSTKFEEFYQRLRQLNIIQGQTNSTILAVDKETAINKMNEYFSNIIKSKLQFYDM